MATGVALPAMVGLMGNRGRAQNVPSERKTCHKAKEAIE